MTCTDSGVCCSVTKYFTIAMNPALAFLRRNIVMVVTIPSIIGLHYGWYCLQHNETFVPRSQKVKVLGIDIKAKEVEDSKSA